MFKVNNKDTRVTPFCVLVGEDRTQVGIYLLKVNNTDTRTRCELFVRVSLLLTFNIFQILF